MKEVPVDKCPLCGSESKTPYIYAKSRANISGKYPDLIANYYICNSCGLMFQNPRHEFDYESEYRSTVVGSSEAPNPETQIAEKLRSVHVMNYIETYLPFYPKNLLDVGASVGHFLAACRTRFGCDVTGVDPGNKLRELAKAEYNIEVWPTTEDLMHHNYDIITCLHVLEHVVDPHAFIGGFPGPIVGKQHLVIEVPHAFGMNWMSIAHVSGWTTGPLKRLFNAHGWMGPFDILTHPFPGDRPYNYLLTHFER
jgi:hypothetical protein